MKRVTPIGFPVVHLLEATNGEFWAVATQLNTDYCGPLPNSTFTRRLEDLEREGAFTRLATTPELQVHACSISATLHVR